MNPDEEAPKPAAAPQTAPSRGGGQGPSAAPSPEERKKFTLQAGAAALCVAGLLSLAVVPSIRERLTPAPAPLEEGTPSDAIVPTGEIAVPYELSLDLAPEPTDAPPTVVPGGGSPSPLMGFGEKILGVADGDTTLTRSGGGGAGGGGDDLVPFEPNAAQPRANQNQPQARPRLQPIANLIPVSEQTGSNEGFNLMRLLKGAQQTSGAFMARAPDAARPTAGGGGGAPPPSVRPAERAMRSMNARTGSAPGAQAATNAQPLGQVSSAGGGFMRGAALPQCTECKDGANSRPATPNIPGPNPTRVGSVRFMGLCEDGTYAYEVRNHTDRTLNRNVTSSGGEAWALNLGPGGSQVIKSRSPLTTPLVGKGL